MKIQKKNENVKKQQEYENSNYPIQSCVEAIFRQFVALITGMASKFQPDALAARNRHFKVRLKTENLIIFHFGYIDAGGGCSGQF